MLFYRIMVKLPFLPEYILDFHTPKILKIIAGIIFIVTAFILYRKPSKKEYL